MDATTFSVNDMQPTASPSATGAATTASCRARPERLPAAFIPPSWTWRTSSRCNSPKASTPANKSSRKPAVRDMQALQFSIPILARPKDNIYAAQFFGPGLGWLVLDYRGHKILRHGGSWGASVTMIPEKNLGVVVLTNIDIEGLAGHADVRPARRLPRRTQVAWDQAKWESTWLKYEGPGKAYRPRDEAKAELDNFASPAPAHCARLKTTPEPINRSFTATWSSTMKRPTPARLRRLQYAVDTLAP